MLAQLQHGGVWCESRKYCYMNRVTARSMAEAQMDRDQAAPGHHIEAYQCNRCGYWHTGGRKIVFKD